jgi:hypothetical protein
MVYVYVNGNNKMYILAIPDEKNRTGSYELSLSGGTKSVTIYTPQAGADAMVASTANVQGGKVKIAVTETPVFVQPN